MRKSLIYSIILYRKAYVCITVCLGRENLMETVNTYPGHITKEWHFIPDSKQAMMTAPCRATLYILGDEAQSVKDAKGVRREAFEEFFSAMLSMNEEGVEPIDDEFVQATVGRMNIARELDL